MGGKQLFALANAVLVAGIVPATALDQSDLGALQSAVREMCVQPDRAGNYVAISGDL